MDDRFPWLNLGGTGTVEALLACGVRWEETNAERLGEVRRSLLKARDYELRRVESRLRRPEICAPETYHELFRTPKMPIKARQMKARALERIVFKTV